MSGVSFWYTTNMKIISLNTWGGRAGKDRLHAFIEANSDTDVFCLQEIWSAPYEHLEGVQAGGLDISHEDIMVYGMQELSGLLPDHTSFFHPHHLDNYGLLMLVKKNLEVTQHGEVFVHKYKGFVPVGDVGLHARNVQFVEIKIGSTSYTILNFHGLWNGNGKTDSEDRLEQSRNIVGFLNTREGEVVFCGDFNLLPDTESIRIIERTGMRNLVIEYGVNSTRTLLYSKPEKFADYIFVSPDVEVKDFKVLRDVVSDHAPLLVEIG